MANHRDDCEPYLSRPKRGTPGCLFVFGYSAAVLSSVAPGLWRIGDLVFWAWILRHVDDARTSFHFYSSWGALLRETNQSPGSVVSLVSDYDQLPVLFAALVAALAGVQAVVFATLCCFSCSRPTCSTELLE